MILNNGEILLRAILAKPKDSAPRLAYADWLDENGQEYLAQCLRDVVNITPDTVGDLSRYDAITLYEACKLAVPVVERIDRLMPIQEAMLPVLRDAWLRVGLGCGGGYDLGEVKRWIGEAYKVAGLLPPTTFIELPDPLQGAVAAAMLAGQVAGEVHDHVWDQVTVKVRDKVLDQVLGQVWIQVVGQVHDQVHDQVVGQVRGKVAVEVRSQVIDQVWDQVAVEVRRQAIDQVRGKVRDQVYTCCYGLHDAGWLSFYATMRCFGIACADRLEPLIRLASMIGWWWPFNNSVIITPRPSSCEMHEGKLVKVVWGDFVVNGKKT